VLGDDLLPRIPNEPPRSVDLLPGLSLSRAVSGATLIWPLGFLALFALMPVIILLSDEHAMLSVRRTETTAGRVERTQPVKECAGDGVRILYSFSPPERGVLFRGHDVVCPRTPYSDVREGDSVPVVYLTSNPAINAIAGGQRTDASPWPIFFVFPLFGLMFFAPLFWPRYSQLLRDRKLFRTGTVARGTVVFVVRQQDSWWPGWPLPTRADVYVQARFPMGEEREVRAVCTNDWLLAHLPPGAEVTVSLPPRQSKGCPPRELSAMRWSTSRLQPRPRAALAPQTGVMQASTAAPLSRRLFAGSSALDPADYSSARNLREDERSTDSRALSRRRHAPGVLPLS